MEGRRPPPPGVHTFTDKVRYDKFWGTPYAKGFFKFAIPFTTGWLTLLFLYKYITRHETHFYGIPIHQTDEEIKKRAEILNSGNFFKKARLPLDLTADHIIPTKGSSVRGADLSFDDSVTYVPALIPTPFVSDKIMVAAKQYEAAEPKKREENDQS